MAHLEQSGDKCGRVISTLVYLSVLLNIVGMSYIVWNNFEIRDTLTELQQRCNSDAILARTLADLLAISFIIGLGSLLNNMVSIKIFCFGEIDGNRLASVQALIFLSTSGCIIGLLGLGVLNIS